MPGISNTPQIRTNNTDQKILPELTIKTPTLPSLSIDEKSIQSIATVAVYSLDYDGCLANRKYNQSSNIIECNLELFKTISHEIKSNTFSDVIIMTGSNRQSFQIDQLNAFTNDNGSSFPKIQHATGAISKLSNFNCTLDTSLLADFFHDKPAGDSYQIAMRSPYQANQADTCFDESKLTLIYAQIHKIASENPFRKIIYNFYDDRNEILSSIKIYYMQHPEFLPSNVTLQLYFYDGTTLSTAFSLGFKAKDINQKANSLCDHKPIQGTGVIDFNFRNTLKVIAKNLGNLAQNDLGDMYYSQNKLTELLTHFRNPKVILNTMNKEQGKIKNLEKLTPAFNSSPSKFPELIRTNTVIEEDQKRKKQQELDDKCEIMQQKVENFIFQEKVKIEKKIPVQQKKHDKKFFGFFYSSKNVRNSRLQLAALDQFYFCLLLCKHGGNFEEMKEKDWIAISNFKTQLIEILKPYAVDFNWLNNFINNPRVKNNTASLRA